MSITGRRLREAEARARGGLPPPLPQPASIPYAEHARAIQELTKSYELRLGEATKTAVVDVKGVAEAKAAFDAAAAELTKAKQRIDELTAQKADLEQKLAAATKQPEPKPEPAKPAEGGGKRPQR